MPRTKPTDKLGVYGDFDINPEKAVTSYFESKVQEELYYKKPCWDAPREGLQHENIENEREFVEMLAQQEASKKKATIQRKINEKRVDDMEATQLKLREKFIRVNEFMKECAEKSTRSEMQIEAAQKQQEIYREKIAGIERDLDELSKFEEKFKTIIEEFRPYEEVFSEVIESSEIFNSFEELMSQSDALMLAQVEIAEREQELIKNIESIRQKMLKSTHEASQRIIELNTQLAELERNYNTAKAETLKWEKILSRTKDFIADNEKETITLIDSIQHLYLVLAKRNDEKVTFNKFDVSSQLDYIRDEIELLEDIIKRANHKIAKESMSMLGEGSRKINNHDDKGTNLSEL